MLGAIERSELNAGRLEQQVDRAPTLSVSARMIGEKSDALASNEVDRVGQKHFDTRHDAGRRLCNGN